MAKKPKNTKEKKQPEMDTFGLRKNTLTSRAVKMYADGGATTAEVKKALGTKSAQLNVLKRLAAQGYEVTREQIEMENGRKVLRYMVQEKTVIKKAA